MHSIKWAVHVCKNQREQTAQRERELPEKRAEKLYFQASTKKITLAKSYPKWPVARVISHLINSDVSFMSYHWKTTSSPQCVQIFVSDAQWPSHVSPTVSNLWCRNNDAPHKNGIVESDVNIFWYSLGQYKDYMSDGHTAVSADCRESFKAKVPTSTDPGSNCQTI